MAELVGTRRSGDDNTDILDWLMGRENDIANQPHWLAVGAADDHDPDPTPLPSVTARPGDSISGLLGSSDPARIGSFARANGLRPGDSTIYAGRTYLLPSYSADVNADRGQGLLMIRRDNTRRTQLRAQRQRDEAPDLFQQAELARYLDKTRYMPLGRYDKDPTTDNSSPAVSPYGIPNVLDRNPLIKGIAGAIGQNVGLGVGVLRGGLHTAQDTGSLLKFAGGMFDPLADIRAHGLEGSTVGSVIPMAAGAIGLAGRIPQDPGLMGRAIKNKLHQANVELDPLATPTADTIVGEAQRMYGISANVGELLFDVGSTAFGGSELRLANGMNRVREALYVPALMAKYGPASRAALAEPYLKGMGSHYISRELAKDNRIPQWIVDSPFNVSRPPGVTKGEMYMYHAMYDPEFHGASLPKGLDRKGWRFKDFDVERFGPVERWVYGAPGALKGTVGGTIGAAAGAGRYALEPNGPNR